MHRSNVRVCSHVQAISMPHGDVNCPCLEAFWGLFVFRHEHPSIVNDAIQLGVLIQKVVSKLLD